MSVLRFGSRVADAVGQNADEVATMVALVLVTVALWPRFGRLTLLVPGIVLLWIALPVRRPFVARPEAPDKSSRRKE